MAVVVRHCHGPRHQSSEASASPEWQLCREVLRVAESQRAEAEKGGESVLTRQLRRAYSGIITWTQKFVALGDVVSQVDPVHIGLPWAAIRAVLIVGDPNPSERLFYSPRMSLRLLVTIKIPKLSWLRESQVFLK